MKLGPETKLVKRNIEMSKKFDIDVMTGNLDVTVIFLIYGQFGAIRIPNAWYVKLTFSLIVIF